MTLTLDLDEKLADPTTRRTLSHLSLAVAKCKKIVVVTGAGISCSCGIPDFRSSEGLYALVKQQYPDVVLKGRDLFDASLFRDSTSTSVFYTFISRLKRSVDAASPSSTHHFIKMLDSKRKLLRSYTQNIDGLEERAGLVGSSSDEVKTKGKGKARIKVKDVRNVQLHGDIHRVRCTFCSAEYPCTESHLDQFNNGIPPDCPDCVSRSNARIARAARALKTGTLRPAIVLYDEPHPLGDEIGSIQTADINRKPDMLIIMGTSLKVHGFKKLVKDFARAVHDSGPRAGSSSSPQSAKNVAGKVIFVNKTAPGSEWNGIIDYHVVGETDKWVESVTEDWKKMRPADWEVQKKLVGAGDGDSRGSFTACKDVSNTITAPKAKGGKQKAMHNRENVLPVDDLTTLPPLPPSPPSPGKRRLSDSHYDVRCSPSKKRDAGSDGESVVFPERGLLFGDTTNLKERGVPDDFNLGELMPPSVKKSGAKGPRKRVEVLLDPPRKSRRAVIT